MSCQKKERRQVNVRLDRHRHGAVNDQIGPHEKEEI